MTKAELQAVLGDVIPDVVDKVVWSCALARHASGDVSMAVARSNMPCEDQSEVDTAPFGTYVAVYDGHGGHQASSFLNQTMFQCVKGSVAGGGITPNSLQDSIFTAEQRFLDIVRSTWHQRPQYASVGSCVLMGLLSPSALHVASLGDSTAVLGRQRSIFLGGGIVPEVLSGDHNANNPKEREEIKRRFPFDKDIVVNRMGIWRVKGIIQVTRSLGDFYLKYNEFQRPPLAPRFLLPQPLSAPALLTEPTVRSRQLTKVDKFAIFASDGLWERIKPHEACSIVARYPRIGIARRLAKLAVFRGCKARGFRLSQLPLVDPGLSRQVYDDISVIVLFFDHDEKAWASFDGQLQEKPSNYAASEELSSPVQGQAGVGPPRLAIKGLSEFTPVQMQKQLKEDNIAGSFFS